jgi:hypothetical protein
MRENMESEKVKKNDVTYFQLPTVANDRVRYRVSDVRLQREAADRAEEVRRVLLEAVEQAVHEAVGAAQQLPQVVVPPLLKDLLHRRRRQHADYQTLNVTAPSEISKKNLNDFSCMETN